MSDSRTQGRRSPSRAYRPALDAMLEDRVLLSQTLHQYLTTNLGLLKHPRAGVAFHLNKPPFTQNAPPFNRHFRVIHAAAVQTVRGGQAADVVAVDGSHFRIQLSYESNTVATAAGDGAAGTYTASTPEPALASAQPTELPQPIGTVRVYAMPNGEVGIIVDGSNNNTDLTINPLPTPIVKGYAKSYAYGQSGVTHILNIGQITVNSGSIAAIEGFHTANLVGPLVVSGTANVDRIAFNSIEPGASITVGGTLNTLDVLQSITLGTNGPGTGTSIYIGRDLNLLNVGGNITLENGSHILVGRHLGAILQPPKGTGTGSNVLSLNLPATTTQVAQAPETAVSGYIEGNINIDATSAFTVVGEIFYPLYIIGNVTGTNLITFGTEKSTAFAPFPLDIQGTTDATGLAITSAASTTFTVGTPGSFPVTATGVPTPTVIESSTDTLPSGVTFNAATGVLSGTPAAGTGGTYTLHFTAVNTVSSVTQTFTLTVDQPPTITSPASATFTTGTPGTFIVRTTGFPTPTLTETGPLPTGVTFVDNGNGTATLASTAATTAGTTSLTINAANGVTPNATQTFTLTVS